MDVQSLRELFVAIKDQLVLFLIIEKENPTGNVKMTAISINYPENIARNQPMMNIQTAYTIPIRLRMRSGMFYPLLSLKTKGRKSWYFTHAQCNKTICMMT